MTKNLTSTLSAIAVPSLRIADGPWSGKAMTSGQIAPRQRLALLVGMHAAGAELAQNAELPTKEVSYPIQVSEAKSVLQAPPAGYVGNGITFRTPVQAQPSVDALRVDGRAGSPPRGTPV